jgi:hypothetical protein
MDMKEFDRRVDDATHAALNALGISAEHCSDLTDRLNDEIRTQAALYLNVGDDA